jgi:hypothetical protein
VAGTAGCPVGPLGDGAGLVAVPGVLSNPPAGQLAGPGRFRTVQRPPELVALRPRERRVRPLDAHHSRSDPRRYPSREHVYDPAGALDRGPVRAGRAGGVGSGGAPGDPTGAAGADSAAVPDGAHPVAGRPPGGGWPAGPRGGGGVPHAHGGAHRHDPGGAVGMDGVVARLRGGDGPWTAWASGWPPDGWGCRSGRPPGGGGRPRRWGRGSRCWPLGSWDPSTRGRTASCS